MNRAEHICNHPLYFAFVTERRLSAFVGSKYVSQDSSDFQEEYLAYFIEMAIEPEDEETSLLSEEENYLSLFMANSLEPANKHRNIVENMEFLGGPLIKFSRFISSYPQLDTESGIGLIRLSSVIVPPSGMTVYSKDATLLCYSLLGEGEIIVNGRSIPCRKYDCVWADCGKRLQFRANTGRCWECALIRVHGRLNSPLFADACRRMHEDGLVMLTFGAGTRFRSLIWQLLSPRTEASPDPDNTYSHLLLSLFIEINLAIDSASANQVIVPDIILAIQSYLDRNYSRDVSLDDLSRIFSISKYHMSREFKKYVGKSPNDYLIDIRLNRAKTLLVDSRRTIAEIGQLVGIPNTNHFLYLFKSREGITPSAFRKQRI